jgi:ABC-type bacteriocin/lantibiotic exporter with double-glycine peptidase domain
MNILIHLLKKFFYNEKNKTFFFILLIILLNIIKIYCFSYIISNIINSVEKNKINKSYFYYNLYIKLLIIFIILYFLYKFIQNNLLQKLKHFLSSELPKILLVVNNDTLNQLNFNDLHSKIIRLSNTFYFFFNNIFTIILPNIIFLIIISVILLYYTRNIGLIFIFGNLLIFILIFILFNSITKIYDLYDTKVSEFDNYLLELTSLIDKIVIRSNTKYEINVIDKKAKKLDDISIKYSNYCNYILFGINIIIILIIIICIGYLLNLFYSKKISVTNFIIIFIILALYRETIILTISQIPEFIEMIGRTKNIINIFNNFEGDYFKLSNKLYKNINLNFDLIEFQNISFKYNKSNKDLYHNISFKLNLNNKLIGILGNSGNGKSTFAKLLIKMYKINGNILIDNINIKDLDPDYIRKNIIYVSQNSKLFDRKVIDNILYGSDNDDYCKEKLKEIMKFKKINELIQKIDINRNAGLLGDNLSGGQKQIINIINGFILKSKIIILDEPTNSLDLDLKKEVIELIKQFKKYKKSIIIITHDKEIMSILDEKIYI